MAIAKIGSTTLLAGSHSSSVGSGSAPSVSCSAEDTRTVINALSKGKLVAVPTELGFVVLGRGDQHSCTARLRAIEASEATAPLCLCCPDSEAACKYWKPETLDERIKHILAIFWPGALRAVNFASGAVPPCLGAGSRKVAVWVPWNQLCRNIAKGCPFPLAVHFLKIYSLEQMQQWLRENTKRKSLNRNAGRGEGKNNGDLVDYLVNNSEGLGQVAETELDISGQALRVLQLGGVNLHLLKRLAQRAVLLSGDVLCDSLAAPDPSMYTILIEGDPEHVLRRIRACVSDLDCSDSVAYFVSSELVYEALRHEPRVTRLLEQGLTPDAHQPFFWQQLGTRLRQRFKDYANDHNVRYVIVEGISGPNRPEEFMDKLSGFADQVINVDSSSFIL